MNPPDTPGPGAAPGPPRHPFPLSPHFSRGLAANLPGSTRRPSQAMTRSPMTRSPPSCLGRPDPWRRWARRAGAWGLRRVAGTGRRPGRIRAGGSGPNMLVSANMLSCPIWWPSSPSRTGGGCFELLSSGEQTAGGWRRTSASPARRSHSTWGCWRRPDWSRAVGRGVFATTASCPRAWPPCAPRWTCSGPTSWSPWPPPDLRAVEGPR